MYVYIYIYICTYMYMVRHKTHMATIRSPKSDTATAEVENGTISV